MATNDYSRRTKKDVSIDDNHQDSPQSGQDVCATTTDIDIDDIIEKHRTGIIVFKVIAIIIAIAIFIGLEIFAISGTEKIAGKIILGIFFAVLALAISIIGADFVYKIFFKIVVKSIDAIKSYKIRRLKPKALKKILTFDVPIYSSRNKNITKIVIGDATVTASQVSYSQNKGKRYIETIYQCECYVVDIKNKSLPSGIWLIGGSPYHIKKGKHFCNSKGFTIYADSIEAIKNCNINDIGVLSKKIKNAIDCYSFVLYFENGIMYLIEQKSREGFDTDVSDFNIEKYLRRDLAILKYRIEFAKILATA